MEFQRRNFAEDLKTRNFETEHSLKGSRSTNGERKHRQPTMKFASGNDCIAKPLSPLHMTVELNRIDRSWPNRVLLQRVPDDQLVNFLF